MYCLCLDGGGASGYMTIKLLEKIEEATKTPIYEHFDLITGVSTGAIIGSGLATGIPAKELAKLYREMIPKIFPKRNFLVSTFRHLFLGKYKIADVDAGVSRILPEHPLFKTRFMCYCTDAIRPKKALFFKSWKQDNILELKDAILASCSAPTYFPPYRVGDFYYIDGCMMANNTSMCALSEAVKLFSPLDSIYLLNIQVGSNWMITPNRARWIKGVIAWNFTLAGAVIDCSSELAEYQAHQLIGFRNHVIKPKEYLGIDCDNFDLMDKMVEEMWNEHKDALIKKLTID